MKNTMVVLTVERDALLQTIAEDKELQKEMGNVIIVEHTRGFRKAPRQMSNLLNVFTKGIDFDPRKDVYQGELVSLGVTPPGTFPDDEPMLTPAEAETVAAEADVIVSDEVPEGNPVAPLATEANVIRIG